MEIVDAIEEENKTEKTEELAAEKAKKEFYDNATKLLQSEQGEQFLNLLAAICLPANRRGKLGKTSDETAYFIGRESVFYDFINWARKSLNIKI